MTIFKITHKNKREAGYMKYNRQQNKKENMDIRLKWKQRIRTRTRQPNENNIIIYKTPSQLTSFINSVQIVSTDRPSTRIRHRPPKAPRFRKEPPGTARSRQELGRKARRREGRRARREGMEGKRKEGTKEGRKVSMSIVSALDVLSLLASIG